MTCHGGRRHTGVRAFLRRHRWRVLAIGGANLVAVIALWWPQGSTPATGALPPPPRPACLPVEEYIIIQALVESAGAADQRRRKLERVERALEGLRNKPAAANVQSEGSR